ncbi:TPR repeat-containing protein DDB_G0287407-like [Tubulanus polymorphus]|uniref:TPR repeat-containing protein DDB_G0287407-like n=1 Tax=Tubulanus polymorphus TaxID=672921 RepID=UPI003DA20C45
MPKFSLDVSHVHVFVTSYSGDFHAERQVVFNQILPELRAWIESRGMLLQEYDIRWGDGGKTQDPSLMAKTSKVIQDLYFHNLMPYFINITSCTLELVPLWGDHEESVVKHYQEGMNVSDVDLDLLYGAYREDNDNVLFIVREDKFLEYLTSEDRDTSHYITNQTLKQRLKGKVVTPSLEKFQDKVKKFGYEVTEAETFRVDDTFREQIMEFFRSKMNFKSNPVTESVQTPCELARQLHENFMRSKSALIKGRDDILSQIEDYIVKGEKDVPLLLLGGAGSGKSSIMSKIVDTTMNKAKDRRLPGVGAQVWRVFYHFVGAIPGSTDLERMLKRFLREMDIVTESSMPKDLLGACQMCCHYLANPASPPTVLFIEDVNQFTDGKDGVQLSWLPRKLGPNMRCVLSMIHDSLHHKMLVARETKPQELQISPLDINSRKEIITEMLSRYHRVLTLPQLTTLLRKQSSENPLWLSFACEELRLVEDTQDLTEKIESLPEGLLNLLEEVLSRFESEPDGHLIQATLCLLEASAAGLLECELVSILSADRNLMPPSPYEEKDELECSEKEKSQSSQNEAHIEKRWVSVFQSIKPFVRPYGDGSDGRIDFHHRAVSKAVRTKYFRQGSCDEDDISVNTHYWWHSKLADFFENVKNIDRKVEEYPHQLKKLGDTGRLARCLTDWSVFDKLYNEEFSAQLLLYWREVGESEDLVTNYTDALKQLETSPSQDLSIVALRYQHVARIYLQAGKYSHSLELARDALKLEEQELGRRSERMVELFSLMAEIYDEKLKLNDFVSPTQLPDLKKTISFNRQSIAIRKTLSGDYHKFKLGMSLMKLAFSLESWEACGADETLTGADALKEGNEHIKTALHIFKELNDEGHYAEALMTKGVLATRGSKEQLEYYNEAMDICMQLYGENHILVSRLYINIGIVYEDNKNFRKAYEYFKKWAQVSEIVLGPSHPKTLRAKGVLKEERYRRIAQQLGESSEPPADNYYSNIPDTSAENNPVIILDGMQEIEEDEDEDYWWSNSDDEGNDDEDDDADIDYMDELYYGDLDADGPLGEFPSDEDGIEEPTVYTGTSSDNSPNTPNSPGQPQLDNQNNDNSIS